MCIRDRFFREHSAVRVRIEPEIFQLSIVDCRNGLRRGRDGGDVYKRQAESIVMLEEGVWPDNQYTENLPVPPGTVSRAMLDTVQRYCAVSVEEILSLIHI